eukprot:Rhum_TRINITY_DN14594_c25_g1::Rhum_TRINITY_DN14594_c25_g1_i1::g.101567::m.101567
MGEKGGVNGGKRGMGGEGGGGIASGQQPIGGCGGGSRGSVFLHHTVSLVNVLQLSVAERVRRVRLLRRRVRVARLDVVEEHLRLHDARPRSGHFLVLGLHVPRRGRHLGVVDALVLVEFADVAVLRQGGVREGRALRRRAGGVVGLLLLRVDGLGVQGHRRLLLPSAEDEVSDGGQRRRRLRLGTGVEVGHELRAHDVREVHVRDAGDDEGDDERDEADAHHVVALLDAGEGDDAEGLQADEDADEDVDRGGHHLEAGLARLRVDVAEDGTVHEEADEEVQEAEDGDVRHVDREDHREARDDEREGVLL